MNGLTQRDNWLNTTNSPTDPDDSRRMRIIKTGGQPTHTDFAQSGANQQWNVVSMVIVTRMPDDTDG